MTEDSNVTDSGAAQSAKPSNQKTSKSRKKRGKPFPAMVPATSQDKNLGGRPKALVWDKQLEAKLKAMASAHCTQVEAAAFLGVCEKTLQTFFNDHPEAREAFRIGRELGKISLRRKQNKLAEKNAAMAIFLGKNYLDQTDKIETVNKQELPALDISHLTEEQQDQLEELLSLAVAGTPEAEAA